MNDVLILCYHAVSERWPASLSVLPREFQSQLESLVNAGYSGVTFTQAIVDPPAGKIVAVTFDDGYRSVARVGYPVMKRLGIPGTVFVATDHVGTEKPMVWSGLEQWVGTEYESELVAASWPEWHALVTDGWEIGAHTRSHPHLTRIDEDSIDQELTGSRQDVEKHMGDIGGPCTSLAYPYGDHDARVVAAAARAGFVAAGALPHLWYRPDPLRWPRVYVAHRDDARRFKLKVSRVTRLARVAAGTVASGISDGRRRTAPRGS